MINTSAESLQLAIISGRSGSGKSTALNVLEDAGYYCIDNLPIGMLSELVKHTLVNPDQNYDKVAVCIDARNALDSLPHISSLLEALPSYVESEIIYLDASDAALFKRFSETRRKHPLSSRSVALQEALNTERELLNPIADAATLVIDTSLMNLYELRDIVRNQIVGDGSSQMAILFESFGFKHGIPNDCDLLFDVRCLPNPYWMKELRAFNGRDQEIVEYLNAQPSVREMRADILHYLEKWLPAFEENSRSYMTVAIGCTGGQHRSVYISEFLCDYFTTQFSNVQVRHRELKNPVLTRENDINTPTA